MSLNVIIGDLSRSTSENIYGPSSEALAHIAVSDTIQINQKSKGARPSISIGGE